MGQFWGRRDTDQTTGKGMKTLRGSRGLSAPSVLSSSHAVPCSVPAWQGSRPGATQKQETRTTPNSAFLEYTMTGGNYDYEFYDIYSLQMKD